MGNSLTSERSTLKKNDTGRLVITARVKGTRKKNEVPALQGKSEGKFSDGRRAWSGMLMRSVCFTFVWVYYYYRLVNVSLLCCKHTFQDRSDSKTCN